jgi:hypothetical protein
MDCHSGNEISASEAIQHMQLRLSAEQVARIDVPKKTFADTDKIIEHMRSRLSDSCRQSHRTVLSPGF